MCIRDRYNIQLKEGQFFTESQDGVIVNRKLADLIGEDVLAKYFQNDNEGPKIKILGVVDQVLFNDFKAVEEPLVIFPIVPEERDWVNIVNIRVTGGKLGEAYDRIKKRAEEIFGEQPVVRFLNEDVEYWLTSEKQTSRMVSFFSVLAILISCLGLFGLATFMMEQKRKEIGIRRVNGCLLYTSFSWQRKNKSDILTFRIPKSESDPAGLLFPEDRQYPVVRW